MMEDPAISTATHALDAMTASPDHHAVLLENDRVRVLDTHVGPGERTAVHVHEWPAALYVLGWSDFVRMDGRGNVLVDSRSRAAPEAGTAFWIEPLEPHCVENVGQGELRIIAVELKPLTLRQP